MARDSVATVGLTLDDLRQPSFNGRVWGYDREEVNQLLAAVVTSIERLQRRRDRDAAAIERATAEATAASARADRAQEERDDLAVRLELALRQVPGDRRTGLVAADGIPADRDGADRDGADRDGDGVDRDGADRDGGDDDRAWAEALAEAERLAAEAEERAGRAQRLVAEADGRAGRAERQVLGLREEVAQQRARTRRMDFAEAEVKRLREELARVSERARRAEVRVAAPATMPAPPTSPRAGGALVPAVGGGVVVVGGERDDFGAAAEAAVLLPLAQRAARALLREARASAATIVADAEQQALALRPGPTQSGAPGSLG